MPRLAGLQDLYRQVATPADVRAMEEDQGTVSDPRHGHDKGGTYPWIDTPHRAGGNVMPSTGTSGLEVGNPFSDWILPAGTVDPDQSPAMHSHAAPYPRMGPETSGNLQDPCAEWEQQRQRAAAHAVDQGSPRINTQTAGDGIEHDEWHVEYSNNPGQSALQGGVPAQLRGGPGGHDVVQGYGGVNRYGFGAPHVQYRAAIGGVPFNRQWLNAAERPLIVPQRGVQATFDGGDSPYGAAGDTHRNQMLGPSGAAVMGNPTAYRQPSAPNVNAAYPDGWSWAY